MKHERLIQKVPQGIKHCVLYTDHLLIHSQTHEAQNDVFTR